MSVLQAFPVDPLLQKIQRIVKEVAEEKGIVPYSVELFEKRNLLRLFFDHAVVFALEPEVEIVLAGEYIDQYLRQTGAVQVTGKLSNIPNLEFQEDVREKIRVALIKEEPFSVWSTFTIGDRTERREVLWIPASSGKVKYHIDRVIAVWADLKKI